MDSNVLRKDYLLDRWVVVAAGRAKRPQDNQLPGLNLPSFDEKCVFCPGNESKTPPELGRVGSPEKWSVRAFANKFAAFSPDFKTAGTPPLGLVEKPATGFHEVVVDAPGHDKTVWDLSESELRDVFFMLGRRQAAILKESGVQHVFVIKNFGPDCGASLAHSHWQLFGLPMIPSKIAEEKIGAALFFKTHKKEVFDFIVESESASERRIFVDEHWVAFCPFAGLWPYEFWIVPRAHVSSFSQLSETQVQGLSSIVLKAFRRLKLLFGNPQYNLVFHESMTSSSHYRFHIEVYPNIKKLWAGLEKGAGVFINEVPPEFAAHQFRGDS